MGTEDLVTRGRGHPGYREGLAALLLALLAPLAPLANACATRPPELTLRLTSADGNGLDDAPLVVARFAHLHVAAHAEAIKPHGFDLMLPDTPPARRAVGLLLRPMRFSVHGLAPDQSGLMPDPAVAHSGMWSDRKEALAFAARQPGTVHAQPFTRGPPDTTTEVQWRAVRLAEPEVVGPADIVSAEVTGFGPSLGITIKLKEAGTARFAAFTEAMIGQEIALSFDDEIASMPVVRDKITGGLAMVTAWEPERPPDIVARAQITAAVLSTGPLAGTWSVEGDFVVPAGADDRPRATAQTELPNPDDTVAATPLVQVGDQTIDLQLLNLGDTLTPDFPKSGDRMFAMRDAYQALRFLGLRLGDLASRYGPEPKEVGGSKLVKVTADLVEGQLVAADARTRGLKVTDDIGARLTDFRAAFSEPGSSFDPRYFRDFLQRSGVSEATFDRFVENELLREKVIQEVIADVAVTDAEAAEANARDQAAVELEVLSIDARTAAALVPIDARELAAWRRSHEPELAAAYDARKSDFTTPRRLRLRLLRLAAPDPSEAADGDQAAELEAERAKVATAARDLAGQVQAQASSAKQSATFAAAAQRLSADTATAARGGLVGDVTIDALRANGYPRRLLDALETAQPGLSIAPIETRDGFWLALIERADAPHIRPLAEVAPALARTLLAAERAPAYIEQLAAEAQALATAQPEAGLDAIATQLNAKARVSDADGAGARKRLQRLVDETNQSELGRAVRAALATTRPLPLTVSAPVHDAFNPKILSVVRIVRRVPVTPLGDSERADRKAALLMAKQHARYRAWYAALHDRAIRDGRLRFTPAYDALIKEGR